MHPAEELRLRLWDDQESLVDFNWGIKCSDLSTEKVSVAAVGRLVRGGRTLAAAKYNKV